MDPTTFDLSGFNWLGFILAIVANVIIGFIWYAQWFPTGKVWIREMKMDTTQKIDGAAMAKSMGLMLLGSVLMMFVFAHNYTAYADAFSNTAAHGVANYKMGIMDGVMGGVFTTLGFIVPLNLNAVAFEKKPWSLFFINCGYYLVALVVAGILLVTVGV